jgi:hypothetical protein
MNEKKLCFSIGVLSGSYIVISVTKTSFQRGSLQVAIRDFHVRKPNHYYLYLYVLCPVTIFLNSIYDPSTVQKREFLSIDFSRGGGYWGSIPTFNINLPSFITFTFWTVIIVQNNSALLITIKITRGHAGALKCW